MQEDKYKPDLSAIYEQIADGLRKMNNGPTSEDIINFETNIGFILSVFPGCHYECELKDDTYDQYVSITFFYDRPLDKDLIKTIYISDC